MNIKQQIHAANSKGAHTCNDVDCPPTGGYYVSALDGNDHHLMAGPYQMHQEALDNRDKALHIADKHDGRAWFMSWGTCRIEGSTKPGQLNKFNLI